MPTLSLIAGPNGSGKSTLTSSIRFEGNANLIDPDAIARRLNAAQPARAAIPAAREAILRCKSLLADRASFTLETTLAGKGAMGILRRAKDAGYHTFLVYVSLGNPELHIERVRLRVSQGGHDIPDADIRRCYQRSLMRAPEALRLAEEAIVLDNSGLHPVRMLLLRSGRIVSRADVLPGWTRAVERVPRIDCERSVPPPVWRPYAHVNSFRITDNPLGIAGDFPEGGWGTANYQAESGTHLSSLDTGVCWTRVCWTRG